MNNYIVKFDKILLNDVEIELTTTKIYNIFEELIDGNCIITYEDDFDYGYTLLFRQLQNNKEEYDNLIKDIEQQTKEELDEYLVAETSKSLKNLL